MCVQKIFIFWLKNLNNNNKIYRILLKKSWNNHHFLWTRFSLYLSGRMEILEIGEIPRILHSSQNLEAVFQMLSFFSDFATVKPVHRKELQKDNRNLLENFSKNEIFFILFSVNRQHFSDLFNTIGRLLFGPDIIIEVLKTHSIFCCYYHQRRTGRCGKSEICHGSPVILHDVISRQMSFERLRRWLSWLRSLGLLFHRSNASGGFFFDLDGRRKGRRKKRKTASSCDFVLKESHLVIVDEFDER